MSELNSQIKDAIDMFDTDKARTLLRDALKDANAETYYLASLVALDDRQRKMFLEKALEIDPFHANAYSALNDKNTQGMPSTESSPASDEETDSEDAIYITGAVSENLANLYTIPHKDSITRTNVPQGSEVQIFERDEQNNWYYVSYLSTIGAQVYGWIKANVIDSLHIADVPINPNDLPITEFRQNIRDDVLELIELKKQSIKDIELTKIGGFEVRLIDTGPKKINIIKIIRQSSGIGLKEAKYIAEHTPQTVVAGISKNQAEQIKIEFEKQKGAVEIISLEKNEDELRIEREIKAFRTHSTG